MKKTNKKFNIVNNVQDNDGSIMQQVIEGSAFYSMDKGIFFAPFDNIPDSMPKHKVSGTVQQMSDGTFDFVPRKYVRAKSELIRKLAHGRASKTQDGAIQVTIKVYCDENVNVCDVVSKEAYEAVEGIREYQLKH